MPHFEILSAFEQPVSRSSIAILTAAFTEHGHTCALIDVRELPEAQRVLSDRVSAADGMVFLLPAHGGGSVAKAATELVSPALRRKPVALVVSAGSAPGHAAARDLISGLLIEHEAVTFPRIVEIAGEELTAEQGLSGAARARLGDLAAELGCFASTIRALWPSPREADARLAAPATAATHPGRGAEPIVEPIGIEPFHVAHLNILTRDWKRSLDFYQRVFGARYMFHLGDTKIVTEINGFEFFLEEVERFTINPAFHFGIRTTNDGVDAFARRLERLGVPMVKGNNPSPGPMRGPDGVRVALYIEDPDGWLIEVYCPEKLVLDSDLLKRDPRWPKMS